MITVLPYAGTSGWSGSRTSESRAIAADDSGLTSIRQQAVLDLLDDAEADGLTWRELGALTGWHHGTASGVLSVLHKGGIIARLSQQRDGCKVYVLPQRVGGRQAEPQGRNRKCPHCGGHL